MTSIKHSFQKYCHDISKIYSEAKDSNITLKHKIVTAVAVGAVSLVTLGLGTRWAYGSLVQRFKKQGGIAENQSKIQETAIKKNIIQLRPDDPNFSDDDLKKLDLTNVKTLDLSKCERITNEGLKYLAGLENLEILYLSDMADIDDNGIEILEKNKTLEKLEFLDSDGIKSDNLTVAKEFKPKPLNLSTLDYFSRPIPPSSTISQKEVVEEEILENEVIVGKGLDEKTETSEVRLPESLRNIPKDVVRLDLSNSMINDADLSFLVHFKNLKQLDLSFCSELTDKGLGFLKNLPQLETLSLIGCRQFSSGAIEQAVEPLIELVFLDLSLTQIGNLNCLEHLKKLKQLYLVACDNISNEALASLQKLRENLTYLRLSGCTNISNESLEYISGLKELKELHLNDTNISNEETYDLSMLTDLERLGLNGTKISDDFLEQLINLKKLGVLNLNRTEITEEGLKRLATNPRLNIVTYENTGITKSFQEIKKEVEQEKEMELKELELPLPMRFGNESKTLLVLNNSVTGEDLKILENIPNIESLSFEKCKNINKEDMKYINQMPQLKTIVVVGDNSSSNYLDGISQIKELKKLIFINEPISADVLISLNEMEKLEILSVGGFSISDEELRILNKPSSLKALELSGSRITYNGLTALSENKSLEWVRIVNCPLNEEQKLDLQAKFKKILFQ